jgi:hypothetical protein
MTAILRTRDIDRGWRELRRKVLESARGKHVLVGVQGDKARAPHPGSKKGLTVGDIATIHEFGAKVTMPSGTEVIIPGRSFLRATFDEQGADLQKRATLLGRAVLLTKITPVQGLNLLGLHAVGLVQKRIADGVPPPNAPSTIKRKGSSKPLIATGQLRASITHEVEG